MMRRSLFPPTLSLLLISGLGVGPALAQDPPPIAFESYQLPNGLQVILAPDHANQVVAVDVWYHVGSRNERPGRSGFAHLFEHMMFQGSAHVKKAEHFQLVERAGGFLNGSTTEDRTNYFEALPSNQVNLALWLEADRMRSLAVTDSNFHNQREAVKEERRLRVDNQPYAGAFVEGVTLAFDSTTCFPYAHSAIGSMADLDAAKTEDVQEFFRTHYAPNNATVTVTGDFDPAEVKGWIERYFGSIPRGSEIAPAACEVVYGPGLIQKRYHDPKATLPATFRVFRVPPADHADAPALELLATILGQGESSRLNRVLARETKAAVAAQAFFSPRRGPGLFITFAVANQGVTADSLSVLLGKEIARIAQDLTAEELDKAKNTSRARAISERQRALNVAEALQQANFFLGDPAAANSEISRMMAVTLDDLRRVARTYLIPANTLILLVSSEATS